MTSVDEIDTATNCDTNEVLPHKPYGFSEPNFDSDEAEQKIIELTEKLQKIERTPPQIKSNEDMYQLRDEIQIMTDSLNDLILGSVIQQTLKRGGYRAVSSGCRRS